MPARSDPALRPFHPVVRRWFEDTLGPPSEPQRQGWPAIASGEHTLILAPTGTGKTLAAFLWELNALITEGLRAPLGNAVHLLYISPLKALNNDIQRNLERPLSELRARFEDAGDTFPELRVAVRTGDTPATARARMTRVAPHILITTPESLHIMLTSMRGRGMFGALRAVIIDEIHAVAGSKRGAHLALTLERLVHLVPERVQRIGLSATQRPLDEVARFLGGMEDVGSAPPGPSPAPPRPVRIIDCGLVKQIETEVVSPVPDLGDVGGTVWPSVYQVLVERIRSARTTLVFVNNRAQAERIAAKVNALVESAPGDELALPYHGSLSRERRLVLEQRLKGGELRALVSTSSLELGIDIGSVDLVIQLQSPKRVSNALQRVGRSGHRLGAASRGVMVPTHLDDAMEIVAITRAMHDGDVEPTRVVQNALDVLAQVIVATVSVDDWTPADLFTMGRRAYPYHALTRTAFDEVLAMLSGKYPSDLASELAPRVTWDRVSDRVSGTRASRLTSVISGGTIPTRGYYAVVLPDRTRLGELDEEFVHESRLGDVFQLGSTTWRIGAIEHDRVIVTPAPGAPARMPFWHGEHMARASHLASRVGSLRRALAELAPDDEVSLGELAARHGSDRATIASLAGYVREQRAATAVVPDERTLVLETFRDETNAVRMVLHSPFGGRVNAPWGMALAQRVREALAPGATDGRRTPDPAASDVQVQTTDDGIMLRLPDLGRAAPIAAMLGMSAAEAERRVVEEVGSTSLFGAHFRMNAARALLLPRGMPHRRMPLWLQRLKALDLLQTVREWPSFPILLETYREVLQDAFDLPALAEVLGALEAGRVRVHVAELDRASPFSSSLRFGFVADWLYGDDTPRAERTAAILSLDRGLLDELMGTEGADEDTLRALNEVLAIRRGTAARRRARTADELAVLVDRAGDVTLAELRQRVAGLEEGVIGDPIAELLANGRLIAVDVPTSEGTEQRFLPTERWTRMAAAFGASTVGTVWTGADGDPSRLASRPAEEAIPGALRSGALTRGAAARELVNRWLALAGPVTADDVRRRYRFPPRWIRARLDEWERTGMLVRGLFGGDRDTVRWSARRPLEHARRRALASARAAIEAVPLPAFVGFLQRWQHIDPRDRLDGEAGVEHSARQMYGLARPASRWERDYLPARVRRFDPAVLSRMSARGELIWVGGGTWDEVQRMWSLSTIRFLERGTEMDWLPSPTAPTSLSPAAERTLALLRERGASFVADVERATGLRPVAAREALRELVAAGLVTNDTVDAMREIVRLRGMPRPDETGAVDPTRWLPADFSPGVGRPVVQRRVNPRRLARWRRPDLPGGGRDGWVGRWSVLERDDTAEASGAEARAERVTRQLLDRYGLVSREMWRRDRPAVSWRAVYHELRRLEYRGEVRRGYFVRGLGGAQFALPQAVEQLRGAARDEEAPLIVMATGDPADAYSLDVAGDARDPLSRPRGRGGLLVTRGGRVLLAVEGRGKSITVAPGSDPADVSAAARALVDHLALAARTSGSRRRDLMVERIDGASAARSRWSGAFRDAGFRADGLALRLDAVVV